MFEAGRVLLLAKAHVVNTDVHSRSQLVKLGHTWLILHVSRSEFLQLRDDVRQDGQDVFHYLSERHAA